MYNVTIQHDQKIAFSAFVCPYPKGCKARKRAGSLQGWGKTGRFLLVFPPMLNSYYTTTKVTPPVCYSSLLFSLLIAYFRALKLSTELDKKPI